MNSVYIDTSVLGHWMLYHFRKNRKAPIPRNVQSSMQLIRHIKQDYYGCEFETSDFALRELLQVIRDNILAAKMLRDAQPLSYFHQLKDYYSFEQEEWGDAWQYLTQLRNLLNDLNIVVSRTYLASKRIELSVQELCFLEGVELNDAIHIAWAYHRKCKYLVTTDKRLLDHIEPEVPIGGVRVLNPATLAGIRDVRKQVDSHFAKL